MRISVLGLTLSSAWGNGHATTYRSLCQALHKRGHTIRFLEKDVPWYSEHRDLSEPEYCELRIYREWSEAREWLAEEAKASDLVILGSYFPDGQQAAQFLFQHARCPVFFYDIDTPITLARLRTQGATEALRASDIPRFDAYLTFTGGPVLQQLEHEFRARRAFPLYCSVDPNAHRSNEKLEQFEGALSYLGTYSEDRQPKLQALFVEPAQTLSHKRFVLAGAQYPQALAWPANVHRFEHVPPDLHSAFYSSSRFTLNLTRDSMVAAGWSPSVRLFEAAACGAAILSDTWPGLDELLTPGKEVLPVACAEDVVQALEQTTEAQRKALGEAARARVLAEHTSSHRAMELERIVAAVGSGSGGPMRKQSAAERL